jgi:hypothetical protein
MTPAGHACYPELKKLAQERLSTMKDEFYISFFLSFALPFAANNKDWSMYDAWAAQFRSLPAPLRRDYMHAALLNMDGNRALDEQRYNDEEQVLKELVEIAPTVEFLSNAATSGFVDRMRSEGRAISLCNEFDEIKKKFDWRLLDRDDDQ